MKRFATGSGHASRHDVNVLRCGVVRITYVLGKFLTPGVTHLQYPGRKYITNLCDILRKRFHLSTGTLSLKHNATSNI